MTPGPYYTVHLFPSREPPLPPPDDLYAAAAVSCAATQQPCGDNWRPARLLCLNVAEVLLWWLLSVLLRPSHSFLPLTPHTPSPPCPSVLHLLCFSPPMGSGPGMDWSWSLVSSVVNHVYYKHHLLSHFSEGCSPPCLTQSTSWQPVRVWQLLHLKRSGVNGFDYLFIAYQDHVDF